MVFEIIFQVLVILAAAVIAGEVFEQFRLPSVAGELLSGLILGPTVLGIIPYSDQLQAVASISLFFIIFLIGFEMNVETMRKHVPSGVLFSATSFLLPLIAVFGVATLLFPFNLTSVFATALAITVPSISIVSVLVVQYQLLERESGRIILSSVTVTDVIAFVFLAAISRPIFTTVSVVLDTAALVAAFVFLDWVLNYKPRVFRRLVEKVGRMTKREEISYAVLILVGLAVSFVFEWVGLSYIIGAFFAGLIVHDGLIGRKAFEQISLTFTRMNGAFFIPLFFGFAGVEANFAASDLALVPALALVVATSLGVAIVLTYYFGRAVLKGRERGGARQIAITLGGRGAVGIVIASVALTDGIIGETAYSFVILGTLAASLIVPLLLGRKEG